MPDYANTYVAEEQLLIYEGADFDEVCLADRSGNRGAQVWCWTRRETDLDKAMLKIHHEGRGVCGVFTKDVAATKVELVLAASRRAGHPLQCIMEAA